MEYLSIFGFVSVLYLIIRVDARAYEVNGIDQSKVGFDDNYVVTWGQNNVLKLNQGKEVQLSLDHSSGPLNFSFNKFKSFELKTILCIDFYVNYKNRFWF